MRYIPRITHYQPSTYSALVALGIILLLFSLVGCRSPIVRGEITDKIHEPRTTETVIVTQYNPTNGTNMTIPQTQVDPEVFWIVVKGETAEGELVTRRISVSEAYFRQVEIGDTYTNPQTK